MPWGCFEDIKGNLSRSLGNNKYVNLCTRESGQDFWYILGVRVRREVYNQSGLIPKTSHYQRQVFIETSIASILSRSSRQLSFPLSLQEHGQLQKVIFISMIKASEINAFIEVIIFFFLSKKSLGHLSVKCPLHFGDVCKSWDGVGRLGDFPPLWGGGKKKKRNYLL